MKPRPWSSLLAPARGDRTTVAVVCMVATATLIVALHGLDRELDPARRYLSEYANGSWGWLLTLTLIMFALGSIALADGLHRATGNRLGPGMIAVAGCLMGTAAIFSTDRHGDAEVIATLSGRVHGFTSIGAFSLIVLGMGILAQDLGRDHRWGRLGRATLPLAVTAVAIAALLFVAAAEVAGLRQRAFLALVFFWLVATSLRLRSFDAIDEAPVAGPPPTT